MTELTNVAEFIAQADEGDLVRIIDLVKDRRRTLASITAASLRVGSTVTIGSRISPKYLVGLKGTVKSVSGKRCDVELDASSTRQLRYSGGRFTVLDGQDHYLLHGVPASCALLEAPSEA